MDKYYKYIELIKDQAQDKDGFIEWHKCDGTLFSGLLGSIPDFDIDLDKAFDGTYWHRRSLTHEHKCFDMEECKGTGSSSSISRDMLIGVAYWCWYNKRLDVSEQIIKHALLNYGFMGKANDIKSLWGRCQILPPLFSTFCWISYKLGGPKRTWARWIPSNAGNELTGYSAHLQVLQILLKKDVAGWIYPFEKWALERQAKRSPSNPLFQIGIGNYTKALEQLSNEQWWPSNRLPTSRDRKTEWIPMRDEKDYVPSAGKFHQHSGGDLPFLYWMATKDQ